MPQSYIPQCTIWWQKCGRDHISVAKWCIVWYLSVVLLDLWDGSLDLIRRNTNLKKWNWCTCDNYLARKLNGKCHLVAIHWTTVPVLYCKVKSLDSFEYRAPADFTTMCPIFTLRWNHNERNGVSNHQPHDCLLNRLFRRRSKKTSKLRVPGLCDGNSPGPPTQRASYVENVSIWWHHHVINQLLMWIFSHNPHHNGVFSWVSSNQFYPYP